MVLPRRQVKLVLYGHTHQFNVWQCDGLHFVNQPATSYPLLGDASLGWLSAEFRKDCVRIRFNGLTGKEREHGASQEWSCVDA